jgi:hypothetical protein
MSEIKCNLNYQAMFRIERKLLCKNFLEGGGQGLEERSFGRLRRKLENNTKKFRIVFSIGPLE